MPVLGKRRTVSSPAAYAPAASAPFVFSDLFSGHKGDWYDFTTASRNFTDAGSTPVANVDDLIYQTTGVVNGNHILQATSGNRPKWKAPGCALDNSDDVMFNGIGVPLVASPITDATLTIIAVMKLDGNTNFQRIAGVLITAGGSDTATAGSSAAILRNGTAGSIGAYRAGSVRGTQTLSDSVYALVESEFDGTNHTMTINGVSGTPVASTGNFNASYVHLGFNGGSPSFATLKHLVVINKVLSAGEKTAMRAAYP